MIGGSVAAMRHPPSDPPDVTRASEADGETIVARGRSRNGHKAREARDRAQSLCAPTRSTEVADTGVGMLPLPSATQR